MKNLLYALSVVGAKRTRVARKDAPEAALVELRRAVDEPAEASRAIAAALRDHAILATFAARVVRERGSTGFEGDLEDAFERFLSDGAKRDPGCSAKNAILEALDELDHRATRVFSLATRHVQREASWGPPVDTAAALRARGVIGLARRNDPDLPLVAGALLADKEWPARQGAADALGVYGARECAGLALLKLRTGDSEPTVLLACMSALLDLAPDWGLPEIREALFGGREDARDAAALALGQSSRDEALDMLLEFVTAAVLPSARNAALRGIALHRSQRAADFLIELVETRAVADARAAIVALGSRRFEPGLEARVRQAVSKRSGADVTAALEKAFP